jgi:hypothetical protein
MRSIAGTRTGLLAAASAGVAAIATISLLAGCGVGQIATTASIRAAVPGGAATPIAVPAPNNPNSKVFIENVTVDYNGTAGYEAGASAPLTVHVVNQTPYRIAIAPGPAQVQVLGAADNATDLGTLVFAGGGPTPQPAAPSESASPSASASESASPSGSPSESASPSASPSPSGPGAVIVSASDLLTLSKDAGYYMQIMNLSQPLTPGMTVRIQFEVVADAPGGAQLFTATVDAPIAPPEVAASRSPLFGTG